MGRKQIQSVAALCAVFAVTTASFAQQINGTPAPPTATKLNIVFIITDQRSYQLFAGVDYSLPGLDTITRHGVTFRNHYISSAMCSPSRASFLSGQPPQVTHVIDQLQYPFVPSLSPSLPNMGSALKALGYRTAYFGKFEMDKELLATKSTVNYSEAGKPYGFDVFSAGGDIGSAPQSGFDNDPFIAGEAVRWLRASVGEVRRTGQPFFMVASFVNPHDIMFGNGNVPGQPAVEKAVVPFVLPPLPPSSIYETKWKLTLPASLTESVTAPGMPGALLEYKNGWDGWSGTIPTDRKDMWTVFYSYYLNCVRDEDRSIHQLVDVFNEMGLWRDTIMVYTADHGEMAGAHGGQKGKGPFCYEANAHVPLVIAHPVGKAGATCSALTSHLDLLPTFVGMTGVPEASRSAEVKALPGRDFSSLLAAPEQAGVHAVRPAVLFNYLGLATVDGDYLTKIMSSLATRQPPPPLSAAKLDKRGFLSFVFDGRYKFARFYAPTAFNTPQTMEEIFKSNDVQLFDLEKDAGEVDNLALAPEKNKELILRMNGLLNDMIAREVGVNDGRFLAPLLGSPAETPKPTGSPTGKPGEPQGEQQR
jgi:arylsulfatase